MRPPTRPVSDVFIVGGANSAGQAAVYFARHAESVTDLVRGASLEASMSHYLMQQIENDFEHSRSHVHRSGRRELGASTWRRSPYATTPPAPPRWSTPSWLFVFIGALPRTEWLDGVVVRDESGFRD